MFRCIAGLNAALGLCLAVIVYVCVFVQERFPSCWFWKTSIAQAAKTQSGASRTTALGKRKAASSKATKSASRKTTKTRRTKTRQRKAPASKPIGPIERTFLHTACPADMVNVGGYFCIDRWEATLLDQSTGLPYSPYYPPSAALLRKIHSIWKERVDRELQQAKQLILDQGLTPPIDLDNPKADPFSWLFPSPRVAATTQASKMFSPGRAAEVRLFESGSGSVFESQDLSDADSDRQDASYIDRAAGDGNGANRIVSDASSYPDTDSLTDSSQGYETQSFMPTIEAPFGWVLVGDAASEEPPTPRPVMLLPPVSLWQFSDTSKPVAVSRPNAIPQGYTPGFVAERACRAAGKRLCREQEWVFACKGEKQTKYPYGDRYDEGRCNVFRRAHAAIMMHGNPSIGHSDPRLNLQHDNTGPLLRRTGQTPWCASHWGDDAVMDMVGNIDEWVEEPSGLFLGGFFSRNTTNGCEARVSNHPTVYFDYSTGFRCCADLAGAPQRVQ